MKTQVMKAPRADEKQRARAEMGGGWAGGGGKEGSREEFKRGNLRHPELINAEGEGGEEERMSERLPVWPRGPGTMCLCVVEWVGSQPI